MSDKDEGEITKQLLHERYDYLPIEKSRPLIFKAIYKGNSATKRGDPVGSLDPHRGRYVTAINSSTYSIHRLVWLWKHPGIYKYGEVPKMLDHINQNPLDNRYKNLRPTTNSMNSINSNLDPKKRGSSEYRGVSFSKKGRGWWTAWLGRKYLGAWSFSPAGEIEAALAYDRALWKMYGNTTGMNFPENKENYLGKDHEQLEFGFLLNGDAQGQLGLVVEDEMSSWLNDIVWPDEEEMPNIYEEE